MKKSKSRILFLIVDYTILAFIGIVCLLPMWHVAMASVSDPITVLKTDGVILWPKGFNIEGYKLVFENANILIGYMNTLLYVVVATVLGLLLTVLAGYVLSRKNFLWKNVLMFIFSFTMLFNGGIIPFYLVVNKIGMYDSRWALIVPGCFSVFNMIMMRTAMQSVPESLEESARLDGAGHLTILFKIILPLCKSTLAVLTLYYAVAHWNAWFNASIFLRDRNKFPLQLFLREILIQNSDTQAQSAMELAYAADLYRELVQYCTIMVATVPILVIYPFVQKYFKSGVMVGAVKG